MLVQLAVPMNHRIFKNNKEQQAIAGRRQGCDVGKRCRDSGP